jgi:hypothetical protein
VGKEGPNLSNWIINQDAEFMNTKTNRRKHSVKANVQIPDLTKAGSSMSFEIFANEEKIGEIKLGRGSITWFGKNRRYGHEMSWSRFAKMMDELAYGS